MLNILANQTQVLCDDGTPLTGSITIYNHNTTVKANLYTLEDEQYVPCDNPIYISNGWLTDSLFVKEGLYDVVPEQYEGEFDDMSIDDDASHWVAQRNWSVGLDINTSSGESEHTTTVYGMSSLRSIDPTVYGIATVIGYWTSYDCEPRTFIWDASSVDDEDYGIVITSNVSETGRWILVSDNKGIVSNYYGVPYSQLYINQLFTYANRNGSDSKVNPTKIILTPGEYGDGSTDLIATGKIVEFMPGAKLKEGTNRICCEQVIAGDYTIGDVTINYNKTANGEVKSIWFYSVAGIAACNANKVIVDGFYSNIHKTNSFTKFSNLTFELISDFIASYDDEHPNGYFIFENCKFEGPNCLIMNTNDRYNGCIIDDSLFKSHYINNYKDMFSACSAGNNWTSIESKLNGYYSMGYSAVDCYDMVDKNPRNISMTDTDGTFTIRGVKTDKRLTLGFNTLTLEDCESPDARITTYKNCKIYDSNLTGQIHTVLTATGSQNFNIGCTGNNLSGYWEIARNTSATRNCRVTATIHDNTFDGPDLSFFLADSPTAAYSAIPDNKDFVSNESIKFYNNKHLSNPDYGYGKFTSGDWASAGVTALSGVKTVNGMNFTMLQTGHNTKDYSLEVADWDGLARYGMDYYIPFGYIGNNSRWWSNYRPERTGGSNDAIMSYDRQWLYLTGGFVTGTPGQYQLQNFTHQVKKGI